MNNTIGLLYQMNEDEKRELFNLLHDVNSRKITDFMFKEALDTLMSKLAFKYDRL